MRSNHHFLELEELHSIIDATALEPVFQPILQLGSGEIFGYEGLIRGPVSSPLHTPVRLFAAASRAGLLTDLEMICCRQVIRKFARLRHDRRLFLNLSPQTVLEVREDSQRIAQFVRSCGLRLEQVTIELTEHNYIRDKAAFRQALVLFRSLGFRVAIDDLGEGFSSLRLWSDLHPDFVKIDMHFVQGISQDPLKFQFLKSLQQIAENCGTAVIAEGVESIEDFRLLRDLGIAFVQGFLISPPAEQLKAELDPALRDILGSQIISVYPEAKIVANRTVTVEKLLVNAPFVSPQTQNEEVLLLFETHPELDAIPVVKDGKPMGLILRHYFIELFVRPYYRELHGKRSCTKYMETHPLVVERNVTIQELSETLVESHQRYLSQGFIIIDDSLYLGLGRSQDLIREITQLQLEAARYANPLTMLPGNVPISEHIERLLGASVHFSAAYCDLNHFKAFNDAYGYSSGDEMIKLTARVLSSACDLNRDFVGHIGGDDFIVLFQSDDWEARCSNALKEFDRNAARLFRPEDVAQGAIRAEDRRGNAILFPLTSLAVGMVVVKPGGFVSHLQVATAASEAKKQAKRQTGSSLWIERRSPPTQTQLSL